MVIRRHLEKKWNDIQVGRQGSYSVERLESFNAYCESTSRIRVILVCLLVPLPTLTLAIFLECLPLRNPSEGWRANWMFWIRQAISVFMATFTGTLSFKMFIPVLEITPVKTFAIPFLLSVLYMTTMLVAASTIGYPLPFTVQLGNVVVGAHMLVVLVLVLGKSPFTKESICRPYLLRFQRYQYAYFAFTILYPFCKALHDSIYPTYRNLIVLMLPIWKIGAKYIVISATRELEDIIPQTLSFTVDLYSSLFMSVCMSNSASLLLSLTFIVADVGLTLLEFRELRVNAFDVVKLLNQQRLSQDSLQSAQLTNSPDLLEMILAVTRDPHAYNILSMRGVRLHACLPHPLPEDCSKQLQILAASGLYCQNDATKTRPIRRRKLTSRFFSKTSVQPIELNLVSVLTKQQTKKIAPCPKVSDVNTKNGRRSEYFVLQGLQFLFHCEYLALVEYIECVVPTIFVIYKSVLELLPNVVYYPGGAGKWGTFAMSNILIFALLEVGSFLFLNQFIQRKFKVSPMYQVAFVLEKTAWQIQSMLLLSIFLLAYELAHHGVDFTFRFKWIQ
ncbi:uncharacterized protein PHALS_10772 [Plasmopara halstedii]|uniref:Uncharacterized protein n=1 Tax=Plasmopara halstedii TaxID=4781 RepID=A0A0P1AHK4_PLAHL|nr:uncharacterized protein PHALS_10772 [Plasmopara halstedii]CEG40583.1 hypothetical protein PHALS_10772 [Plasmopara halstedii]|eukprot:XP_024576952.1 hypothetical protein PHALS_10772 [Plasmopara halstedii]